jgi:hypothetical protein
MIYGNWMQGYPLAPIKLFKIFNWLIIIIYTYNVLLWYLYSLWNYYINLINILITVHIYFFIMWTFKVCIFFFFSVWDLNSGPILELFYQSLFLWWFFFMIGSHGTIHPGWPYLLKSALLAIFFFFGSTGVLNSGPHIW